MAKILDGKIVNEKIAEQLRTQISKRRITPKLVIIQVGDLAQSNAYIARKKAFGEKIGAIVYHQKFPEDVTQDKLRTMISKLNTDASVTGIIVQMPLPKHLDKDELIETIDPEKDVDGLTSTNLKLMWEGPSPRHSDPELVEGEESKTRSFAKVYLETLHYVQSDSRETQDDNARFSGFTPATTKGVLTLLDYYKIPIAGKHVVVVGRSTLVGKPTALALLNRDATVTVAHSKTGNLKQITRNADILVVAAGKPKLIGKEHVTKGQVVVDVGINALVDRQSTIDNRQKLVGDVDFVAVKNIVAAISPVPGGIGPMTVASLFENLLLAYNRQT